MDAGTCGIGLVVGLVQFRLADLSLRTLEKRLVHATDVWIADEIARLQFVHLLRLN